MQTPHPEMADTVNSPSCPRAPASQDDMAPVASITAVRASKLLPGFAVKAAHPIASASPSDKHSAMIHKMPFLQRAQGALIGINSAVLARTK